MIPALTRLLELARKATPGPWAVTAGSFSDRRVVDPLTYEAPGWYDNAEITTASKPVISCGGEYGLGRGEDLAYIAALSPELVAALVKVAELAQYLRLALDPALRQARPSADVPCNVDVVWHTGSDTVAQLREALDELRRAVGGET